MKYLVAILFLLTGLISEAQQRIVIENLAAVDSAWISGGNLFYRKNGSTFNAGSVGGAAPVTSVFGRTGVITAQSGDYSSFYFRLSDTSAKTWDWTTKITGKPTFVTTESDPLAFKLTDTSSKNWDWSRITAKPNLVLAVDTGSMLSPYLRKIDTTGKYIGLGWLSSLVTRTELLDSLNNFTELQIDKTLDSLAWQRNDSTLKIKSLGLTAGSSKVTVTPTRTDSTLSYAVDVNEANLTLNNIGGTLDNTKLTTNPLSRSNHTGTQTASTISDFAATTRTSISLTTTGTSGAATYNSSTGVLNIPQYTSSGAVDGGGFPSFEAEFHNVNAVQSQFIGLAIASGTNSTAAGATITTNDHPGVVLIRSSTSANSGYGYLTSSTSNNAQMTMKGGEQFDLVFRTPAAFTNTTVRMGYPNTSSSTLPTDGVWIEFVGSGAVVGRTANSTVTSTTATIATLSANTWYHGRVELSNDRGTATFSLWAENGTSLGSLTLTTNIPATDRQVRIGVVATNSGTTATDLLFVDFMRHKNNQKLNRGNF